MASPIDPTIDSLLRGLQQALQSAMDAHPGEERIVLSRVWVGMWVDQVAAIRLLLEHHTTGGWMLGTGLAVVGFLAGLAVGWSTQ